MQLYYIYIYIIYWYETTEGKTTISRFLVLPSAVSYQYICLIMLVSHFCIRNGPSTLKVDNWVAISVYTYIYIYFIYKYIHIYIYIYIFICIIPANDWNGTLRKSILCWTSKTFHFQISLKWLEPILNYYQLKFGKNIVLPQWMKNNTYALTL